MENKRKISLFWPVQNTAAENEVNLEALMERSQEFGIKNIYPIKSNLTKTLLESGYDQQTLLNNVNETYPLIHEEVLVLIADFLSLKEENGTEIEKEVYKDITLPAFIDRLLIKRPLMFVGPRDKHILRDSSSVEQDLRGLTLIGGFDDIGTEKEEAPLVMEDYMTYDEMKISALLATCSPTAVINAGERRNRGIVGEKGTFNEYAYIVGVVGTRLVKPGTMECQDIRITDSQNVAGEFFGVHKKETMGSIFARFYGIERFPVYKEVHELMFPKVQDKLKNMACGSSRETNELVKEHFFSIDETSKGNYSRKKKLKTTEFFNKQVYEQRIRITAETLLIEANDRAKMANKKAYVHVVGLGLGIWKVINEQHQWYVDVFGESIKNLKLSHISDVDFSWIPVETVVGLKNGELVPGTNTKIHISKRNPYDLLDDDEKIIVSTWAYDSNSYPGNEYWGGSLHTSSDPAAACATQVPELHNPLVNLKMRGNNLRIATKTKGVLTMDQYYKHYLN